MSEVKVNKISPRTNCGTVTLGDSGDTFTFPAGVTITNNGTQTGFGRTGAVDWQTTKKTTTFTATNGEGYFVDTNGGAVTCNLPAGSAGAIVAVADYTRTFADNNLTVSPNGSEKIGGFAGDATLNVNGQAATFVYVDSTEGWINVQNAEDTEKGLTGYIEATGGTITTCGNCKIHKFTGPGTFQVTAISTNSPTPVNNQVSYMVVAGGGSGAAAGAGGGGAGGFREDKAPVTPFTASPLDGAGDISVTATSYPITVGAGGTAAVSPNPCAAKIGIAGSTSTFSTITSAGGGAGRYDAAGATCGQGGSGGGSGWNNPNPSSGNQPPVSPPQGNNGGTVPSPMPSGPMRGGAGGGGATAVGGNAAISPSKVSGAGGAGATTSISGSPTAYAGGGGGGGNVTDWATPHGAGGTGGGGAGGGKGDPVGLSGTAGTANTGGGGGGSCSGNVCATSGAGGSGVVIIRYKYQ